MLLLAQRLGLDLADALARERPFLMPGARERKRARAAMEETGDGVRAWLYLRRVEDYEAAWRAQTALAASAPAFEPGPFPIRIQTPGDLHAARFDLLAWQDPHDTAGFPSPFWVQEGMVEAVLDLEAEPLVPLVATAGDAVERLRLADGLQLTPLRIRQGDRYRCSALQSSLQHHR